MKQGLLEQAISLAATKHAGQVRKDGSPYIWHPIRIATMIRDNGGDEIEQIVALLHDVVEDTDVSVGEIMEIFGAEVADAVALLTKKKGEDETEYIRNILLNPIAVKVKTCDRINNITDSIAGALSRKTFSKEREAFARKYIDESRKYYYGKFSSVLDNVILNAEKTMNDLV